MLQPHISLRVLLRLHSVAITEPRMVAAAAVTSASVTGSRLASDAGAGSPSGEFLGAFGMRVHTFTRTAPIVINCCRRLRRGGYERYAESGRRGKVGGAC